jgi:opacity protein-like surface antigen
MRVVAIGSLAMNRSLLAVLILAVCGSGGIAYAQDNPSGFYLGAGVGQFDVQIDDIDQTDDAIERLDDDDSAWKAFVGYRFNPYIALEAAYVDFGNPGSRSDASGSSGDFRVRLKGFAPYVIGTLPLGPIELFAKIGYYFYDVDLRIDIDDPLAPDFDSSKSNEDLLYGGGIGATVFQHLNVRLEYERIKSDVIDDADALWLSGAWRF